MKFILSGLNKGTYGSGGTPITKENLWTPYVNKWTESNGNIYRNSKVTIGQRAIIVADLGIKQNEIQSAIRIDGFNKSTRSNVLSVYEGSSIRYTIDNWGVPIWRVWSGSIESGAISFTTPANKVGLLIANNDSFTEGNRGYITWQPLEMGSNDDFELGVKNITRMAVSGLGRFRFNGVFISSTTYSFRGLAGDVAVADFRTSAGSFCFQIRDTGILTANPTGSVARFWRLGERIAGSVALDTSQYITVNVNGIDYKLAIVI